MHRKRELSPLAVVFLAVVISWVLVAIIVGGIVSVFDKVYGW
jgi:hypothetical protein